MISGYSSLLRVNNSGTNTATLFALVQPDTGGVPLTGPLGTLAGGIGTVFTEAQIQTVVPGLDLANSGQRSTLQLIVAGTVSLLDEQFDAVHRASARSHKPAGTRAFHQPHSTTRRNVDPIELFFGDAAEVQASGLLVNPNGVVTEMPGAVGLQIPF